MYDPVQDGVTEQYYKILRTCVYSFVGFTVIFGNLLVIIVLPNVRSHSTQVTKMFLYSLTIADFCTGVFLCIPMTISSAMDKWIFGDIFCSISAYNKVFFNIGGLLSLLAVTVDRFLDIAYPLRYPIYVNRKRGAVVLAAIWIIAAFFPFLYGPILKRSAMYSPQTLFCYFQQTDPVSVDLTVLICLTLFVLLPFIITTVLYSRIYCIVKQHAAFTARFENVDGKNIEGTFKFMKTFMLVVICLGIAWLPSCVISFIHQLTGIIVPTQFWMASEILVLTNSGVNVFIYFWRNSDFRKAAKAKMKS